MKIPFVHIAFSIVFLFIFFLNTGAQTTFKTQDELIKKADDYYKDEDYESAMPLYSQLVSIYPKDADYNFRFGVCLIFADRRDNEKPIKYLELASTKTGVDDEVFYYLGLAYHQNYRFADAIKQYNIYKEKAAAKKVEKLDVVRQIEICNSAKTLLTHIADLYVLQKTEVVTKDFFRSYDVARFGGKILVKPDIFKTPLDKKREKFSLCFFSKESNEVYYSSYGKDGENGKDIYKATKDKDGNWGKPENLGTTVNTPYDEDFPFMLGDGATLYFSSNGRNTIGGYDIFTSTLGSDGAWSVPENMNYPINTPFDDIMFVPDSSGRYAYFSSERASMEGMITVYRIRLDTRPEINEVLVFDKTETTGEDSAYAQTIEFLKEKSTLDVNATESMFVEKDKAVTDNTNTSSNNTSQENKDDIEVHDNMTNQDIINLAEKQALQTKNELSELKTKRDVARTIATNRKIQSEDKYQEAASLSDNAANIADENSKKNQLAKAATARSEAEQLNKESIIASNIADQLDKQVLVKQKESSEASEYAKEIKTAVQSNSIDSSIAKLERITEKLQNSPVDTNILSSNPNAEFISKKAKEAEDLYIQSKALDEEIASLKSKAETYRKQADATKKKTLKEEYLQKASDLEAEAKTKQSELDEVLQKNEKVQYEGDSAKTISDLYTSVVEDIQNNNTTAVSSASSNQVIASNTNSTSTTTVQNTNTTANTTGNQTATNTTTAINNQVVASNTTNTSVTNQNTGNTANTTNNQNVTGNTNNTTAENNTNNATTTQNDVAAKNEIISQSEKIIKSVNASADSLKKQVDNAYAIASEKNEQSLKKQKEADNLKAEASEIANTSEQEKYLKQADELSKEAVELARKAVVAYAVAEYLDESYTQKKKESAAISELAVKAKDAANNGNTSDAKEILGEVKTEQNKISSAETADQYESELTNTLDSKQYETEQAQNEADNLQAKADSLSNNVKDLRKQLSETRKQSQQKELAKQIVEVEQQQIAAQKKADAAIVKVNEMKEEVAELKMKVSYTTAVINETETYTKQNTTTVDKTALDKNIAEYENNNVFAENASDASVVNSANNTTADNSANNSNTSSNTSTTVNTQNTTTSNVSNINTSSSVSNTSNNQATSDITTLSNPQLIEAKADIIDKTVVTIRTRIKALQSELKEVKDAVEKENINNEIAQLLTNLNTLQTQSVEMHAEAKDLNNSIEVTNTNTDYVAIAENLESEAVNDLDNATEKRKEANATAAQTEKENLRKEATELEKTAENKTIESFEIKNIGNTNDFYNKSAVIDSVKKTDDNNTQATTAGLLENEAKYYFDKAQALQKTINDDMPYTEKKSVYNDVLTNEKLAIEKQQKAIDIYKQINTTYADNTANNTSTANTNNTNTSNSNNANATTNNNATNNVGTNSTTSVNTNNAANTNTTVVNNTANTNNAVNTTTNNNVTNTANNTSSENAITTNEFKGIYIDSGNTAPLNRDAANLVPLDPSLPSGIVFKVQFCALNKQVAPEVFTGITPVTGESTNFGVFRYLAGLFARYDDAVTARDLIRPKGYADAFVVAYNNGKRITVAEALALLKADNTLTTTYADLNNKTYISTGTATTTAIVAAAANTAVALSNPVANINGLFYSVQVGVYVKPVTSAQLFNITPLYDEIMANGYYRYLSGTFNNLQDAVAAKNAIVTKGVTDAFVVAYYNGKKITFAEANAIKAGNTNITNANNNTVVNNAVNNTNTTNNTNVSVTTNTANTTANSDISFKVQVGAYKKEVPIEIINKWLDEAASNGLEHYVSETGLTIYTSGNFKDYNTANEYKNALIKIGIADAYVVAFQGKEKIAVTKAIELLK